MAEQMSGWTRHGHRISGMVQIGEPKSVARCGGPGLCAKCSVEAARRTEQMTADQSAPLTPDDVDPAFARRLADALTDAMCKADTSWDNARAYEVRGHMRAALAAVGVTGLPPDTPDPAVTEGDVRALRELLAAATPGPWRWSNTSRDVYLFGARQRVVMAFERMGMQGAQPMFTRDGILHPSSKENINRFPDAALIAAAVNALPALLDALDAATERVRVVEGERDAAVAVHRDLVSRLGFGNNITEPMADNDTIVAWFEQQRRDANEWQESQLWRDDCHAAGHPQDDDCHKCDPRLALTARAESAEAAHAALVAGVEALADRFDGYGHGVYCIHMEEQLPCSTCALLADLRALLGGGAS